MGRKVNTTTGTSDLQSTNQVILQSNEDNSSSELLEVYKLIGELQKKLEDINNYKKQVSKYSKEVDTSRKEFEKDKKNIQDALKKSQDSIVQIIGTFVALFTFVSGEIKIFQEIESGYLGIALSFLLLGSLLVFSFCLKILFSKKEDGDLYVLGSGVIIFIGSLGLFYLYQGQYYARQEILDNMKSKISTTTQEVKDNIASTTELYKQIDRMYERNPYLKK